MERQPEAERTSLARATCSRWLACLILGLGFALRVHGLGFQSLWRDETDALFFATRPLSRILTTFTIPGRNGPLYFLLLRGWVAATGQTEFALRFLSVLTGLLSLALTLAVARKMGLAQAGLAGATFMACSPFLIWYAQDAKMYSTVLLAVLLATWLLLQALEKGRPRDWAAYGLMAGASLYLHLLTFLMVPVHGIWLLLEKRPTIRRAAPALVALLAVTLPVLAWGVPLFLSDYESGHATYSLGGMAQALLLIWSGGVAGVPGRWALVPGLFLALAGLFLSPSTEQEAPGGRLKRWSSRTRLAAWLAVPVILLYLISLRVPLFTERYLIWVVPAWYLLMGLGLENLAALAGREAWWRWAVRTLGLVVVLALAAPSLRTQWAVPIKSDFRSAARYVADHRQRGDLVLFQIPHGRRTFQYYYREAYRWAEGPYTNYGQTSQEVAETMRQLTAGYQRVWLVLSEPEMWDRRGLTRQWLETHGQRISSRAYARVDVLCYDLSGGTP